MHTFLVISSDLNIDVLKSASSGYLDLIHQYNFTNLISTPTRATATSQICIDDIFVNFSVGTTITGPITTATSNHYPVFALLDLTKHSKQPAHVSKVLHYF